MAKNPKPEHIGIILDGNRRFAKRLMLKPWQGHEMGAKKVEKIFTWCKELDIRELTLYGLSMENLDRPKEEFDYLMKLFRNTFNQFSENPEIMENGIKVSFIGNTHLLPQDVQDSIQRLTEKTKGNSDYRINIALAYGGRDEIVSTARDLARKVKDGEIQLEDITKELFERSLQLSTFPDFIIRTGGDYRASNFLCYQSAYSEWFYLDKKWPEFEKEDLVQCIDDFCNRTRTFGK